MQYVRKEIKNKEEAIAVALPYIENIIANTNSKEEKEKDKEKDKTQYPKQVVLSRWQFSREALETTLSYIYDHLGHQCYMLCVGKKSPESDKEMIIYKLESADLAPPVRNQINAAIDNIDKRYEKSSFAHITMHIKRQDYWETTSFTSRLSTGICRFNEFNESSKWSIYFKFNRCNYFKTRLYRSFANLPR